MLKRDRATVLYALSLALLWEESYIEAHCRHGKAVKGFRPTVRTTQATIRRFRSLADRLRQEARNKEPR